MHRATSVGSTKSAYRSRVYESDPWEVEDARVGKLGQPDVATGPAIPPYIMGRAWRGGGGRVGGGRQGFAAPHKPAPPWPTPPARPKQTEIGGMAGIEFREAKKTRIF